MLAASQSRGPFKLLFVKINSYNVPISSGITKEKNGLRREVSLLFDI